MESQGDLKEVRRLGWAFLRSFFPKFGSVNLPVRRSARTSEARESACKTVNLKFNLYYKKIIS